MDILDKGNEQKTILCTYVFVGARICLIFLVIIVLKIAKSLRL